MGMHPEGLEDNIKPRFDLEAVDRDRREKWDKIGRASLETLESPEQGSEHTDQPVAQDFHISPLEEPSHPELNVDDGFRGQRG